MQKTLMALIAATLTWWWIPAANAGGKSEIVQEALEYWFKGAAEDGAKDAAVDAGKAIYEKYTAPDKPQKTWKFDAEPCQGTALDCVRSGNTVGFDGQGQSQKTDGKLDSALARICDQNAKTYDAYECYQGKKVFELQQSVKPAIPSSKTAD